MPHFKGDIEATRRQGPSDLRAAEESVRPNWPARASKLKAFVLKNDSDAARGLFADQPSHRTWSKHANTLALLAHVVPRRKAAPSSKR
jgi:hypothetical protein